MTNFKEQIAKQIAEQTKINWEELVNYIEIPPDTKLGDYAFPCFRLAKTLKKAPPAIANPQVLVPSTDGEEKVPEVGAMVLALSLELEVLPSRYNPLVFAIVLEVLR